MSYLRRVLARTAGQPLGPLQAAQPRRWSSQAADPFAAADLSAAAANPLVPPPPAAAPGRALDRDGRSPMSASASVLASVPNLRAGALEDGGQPLGARGSRGVEPAAPPSAPLLARPLGRRRGRPEMLEHRESGVATGSRSSARMPDAMGHEPNAATRPGASAPPSAVALPAMLVPISSPAGIASERRAAPSTAVMPPPLISRREPAAATDPVRPRHDAPAAGAEPRRPTFVVAAPPAEHVAPPQPSAASRPEIVIGRISVVVESARPPAATPRTVVHHVTATPRNADESSGLSHRFGLGQL